MNDLLTTSPSHGSILRDKFELEKRHVSYTDFRSEVVKTPPCTAASSSNHSQKQHVEEKSMEKEEIVRHMSNLPSYLERGKPIRSRALSFGVMDWGLLEKWQYENQKQASGKSNKRSPSCSNSSSLFSTDGSSPQTSTGHSSAAHRVTLQSHLNIAPLYVNSSSGNPEKSQDFDHALVNHCAEKKSKLKDCKTYACYSKFSESSVDMSSPQEKSSSKGKMKIQDESFYGQGNIQHTSCRADDHDHLKCHKTAVLLPRNSHGNSRMKDADHRNSAEEFCSYLNNNTPISCPLQSEVVNSENSPKKPSFVRNSSSTSRHNMSQEKMSIVTSDLVMGTTAASKQRSVSRSRRFSFSFSMNSKSAARRAESPPDCGHSTKDESSNRAPSGPLRRLLDPFFSSKATNSRESCETSHVDLNLKANGTDDDSGRNEKDEPSSTKQALFQATIKNGRPLFTFAVENNSDMLGATMKSLNSSGKEDNSSWIYTFFTVHEVKKKTGNWLSQNSKVKGPNFVPNIAAQMKVSNPSISDGNTRLFILFSVARNQHDCQISDSQPHDQLAAIVVKFVDKEENRERFTMTVILPGGDHGMPSKGEPSPLIERWLSGGACDCGGWDLGCRLITVTNQGQSRRRSNSTKVDTTTGQFELFSKGGVQNERPILSLSSLKDGICRVEYSSSLSIIQAFSICISFLESQKSSQHTESSTFVAKKVQDDVDVSVRYASVPPISSVERV